MQAIVVRDRDAGLAGLSLTDLQYPHAAQNNVIVRVHAAGFTSGELAWAGTWIDRAGRDRTPSVPGHEVSGIVTELGYGTTGVTVGQRVFGLADWNRDGTLAEHVAMEARNLAPLPAGRRPCRRRRRSDLRADGMAGPSTTPTSAPGRPR
jgi:NADPH:quinone reductase-like Zn-dependent oxidoreductase